MLKFVGLRQQNPDSASWDHRDADWCTPTGLRTPNEIPQAWRSLWNWLRGAPRSEGIPAPAVADAAPHLAGLVSRDQGERLVALYDLVALGEQAVAVLVEALLATAGLDRHTSPPPTDPAFHGGSPDHRHRGFTHRQFTPEDTAVALGAVGEPAVAALLELLDHDDPWMRMNAAYAIGEADPNGVCADRLGALLEDQLDAVVRAALDALCCQPSFTGATVQRLHRLLTEDTVPWHAPAMGAQWSIQDQIRYVTVWALTARASNPDPPAVLEAALVAAWREDTGYSPAVACEGLARLATNSALAAAVRYLQTYRCDPAYHRFWRAMVRGSARA